MLVIRVFGEGFFAGGVSDSLVYFVLAFMNLLVL